MFTRYMMQRTVWRRSEIAGSLAIAGGFAFATLIAFFGLSSAASAAIVDVEALARMLAAPQSAATAGFDRLTLIAMMSVGLTVMAGACLVLSRALMRDLEQGARARKS